MKSLLSILALLFVQIVQAQIFSPGTTISVSDTLGNYFPQLEITGDGLPAVIWTNQYDKDLYFAKHNGTDDFLTPVKLNPAGTDVQAFNWSGANIAVDGNNIYVVYRSDGFETGHIYLVKSTDNGLSWSDTVRVDFVADGFAQFPDLAVYNDTVWVVLLDHNTSGLNPHYRVTRSPDGGATWEPDVQASELWPGESCDCCSPEITVDAERVIVFSRNNDNNIREFKGVVSNDRGTSFTGMIDVDEHAWNIMSCPSVGADARMYTPDQVLTAYRTEFEGGPKVYMVQYDLVGDSIAMEIDIQADVSNNNGLVNYPQMDFDPADNRIGIVWESLGNGIDVFLNASVVGPDGLLSSNAINVTDKLGTQSKPDLAIENDRYHIIFTDTYGNDVKYIQITESAAGLVAEHQQDVQVYPNPAQDVVTFTFESTNNPTVLRIVDLQGKIVRSITTNKNAIQVNTDDLAPGTYVYELQTLTETKRGKLIVN